ncbi:hypothetical protein TARUN_7431 [Trichoderma arundinaceum]|uniref:Uncharacterized protein n=1 Tax=Trichoderma arundinaceum TaxID=490622 RepID=A0A395NG42_TRIAR|nr:hypothetical protein TARUN_7431 [Trichoderma arundinaceum]
MLDESPRHNGAASPRAVSFAQLGSQRFSGARDGDPGTENLEQRQSGGATWKHRGLRLEVVCKSARWPGHEAAAGRSRGRGNKKRTCAHDVPFKDGSRNCLRANVALVVPGDVRCPFG